MTTTKPGGMTMEEMAEEYAAKQMGQATYSDVVAEFAERTMTQAYLAGYQAAKANLKEAHDHGYDNGFIAGQANDIYADDKSFAEFKKREKE